MFSKISEKGTDLVIQLIATNILHLVRSHRMKSSLFIGYINEGLSTMPATTKTPKELYSNRELVTQR